MNSRLTTLIIGIIAGSITTLLGIVLSLAFTTVAITASFMSALVAFVCTLLAVVIAGGMVTLCSAHLMRTSAELVTDVADITAS
jgi:hypothetical protein